MNFNQKRSTLSAGLRLFHPHAVLTARVLLTLAVGLRPFQPRAVLTARVLLTLAVGLRPIQSKTGESLDASIPEFPCF